MNVFEWIVSIYLGIGIVITTAVLIMLIVWNRLKDYSVWHNVTTSLLTIIAWPFAIWACFKDDEDDL